MKYKRVGGGGEGRSAGQKPGKPDSVRREGLGARGWLLGSAGVLPLRKGRSASESISTSLGPGALIYSSQRNR